MGGARRGTDKTVTYVESAVFAVGSLVTLDGLDSSKAHCFAGVQFFNDAAGLVPATPTAGTLLVEIRTVNTTPIFEAIPANTISANAPTTISWAANTQAVRATPTGIVGATHYKLVVTCNET